jgi:CHAD domain-containing protein
VIALMSVIAVNPDNDTTPLFELRLALRHSLAALTVYQGLLPLQDFRWIKQQLTQLRIATDDVRDDDVMDQIFIEEFSCCSGNYPFGNFKQERSNVQQPLLGLLEGLQKNDLFKNRVEQMLSQIAWSPINGEELSLHELAKKKLSTCLAETFVSLPTEETSFVELHRFRIRIKKLRYMFEILEDTLPLSNYAVIYPQLVSLQSTLGRIHDLFNVEQRIEKELNNATSDDAAFFQTLLLQCDALLQQAHQDFFNDFTPAVFQKLQDDIKTTIDSL